MFYFFLVVDDGRVVLIHLLPAGKEGDCDIDSAFETSCRLDEANPTSRTDKNNPNFDLRIKS